jgi:Mg-chelatase subunit ChlD
MNVIFLLDSSGSMQFYSSDYVKGLNNFINAQKQFNSLGLFSLIKFNSRITPLCIKTQISQLPTMNYNDYNPAGMTSLYDAIGYTLDYFSNDNEGLIIILSDGQDTSSKNYTNESIRQKIELFSMEGWSFLYLGTNQDAHKEAKNLNIQNSLAFSQTTKSINAAINACNIAVGHKMAINTKLPNKYSQQDMPTDLRELNETLEGMKI